MATTGEVFPSAGASVLESPWSDNAWTSPGSVTADDGTYASVTATTFDSGDQTYVLKASGFDFSSIPAGSTIDGIIVRIQGHADSTSVGYDLVQLLDTAGAKVGTNKSDTSQRLTTADAVYTFGTSTDLWGNALTAAWVKDPDFGVAIGGHAYVANSQVFVDYVTVEVFYTPPALHLGKVPSAEVVRAPAWSGGIVSPTAAGPNYPSSAVGDTFGTAWSNPGNVEADDSVYASCFSPFAGTTEGLNATAYGFAIPSDATITGISVEIQGVASDPGIMDNAVVLLGTSATENKARTSDDWALSDESRTYGDPRDLWGASSITPAEVNDPGFGVDYAADLVTSSTMSLDVIAVTVYYYPAAPSGQTLSVGKVGSGAVARGTDLAQSGPVTQAVGKVSSGAAIHGADLTAAGPASLAVGKVASSATVRGADVTASGPALLHVGKVASGAAAHGITLAESGPVSQPVGHIASGQAVHGIDLAESGPVTQPVGKVASTSAVHGVTIGPAGPVTLTLGKVASGAAVRGADVAQSGPVTLSLGKVAGSSAVRGADVTESGPVALAVGKVGSSAAVHGVGLAQAGPMVQAVGKVPSSEVVHGIDIHGVVQTLSLGKVVSTAGASASDDFNRADGGLGANWTEWTSGGQQLGIASDQAYCANHNNPDAGAFWNADTFVDDQFSQVTMPNASVLGSANWIGVAVRVSPDGNNNYLCIYFNNGGTYVLWLFRKDSGTYTPFGSGLNLGGPLSDGDVLRIEAEGTTIRGLVNGTELVSVTDATYASGAPAIAFYANNTTDTVNDWQGGDLGAVATGPHGITLAQSGPVAQPLGKVPSSAQVRGVTLGGGVAQLALGKVYGAGSYGGGSYGGGPYGGNVHGLGLAQSGPVTLPLGKIASSTATHGIGLTQSGPATLAVGRISSSGAAHGVSLAQSGPVALDLGRVSSTAAVHGIDLALVVPGTLQLGKVPSAEATHGLTLAQSGPVTLDLGHIASGAAVRGVTLAESGPVQLQLGHVPSSAAVHGADVTLEAPGQLHAGKVPSSSTVRGITFSLGPATPMSVGKVAGSSSVRGVGLSQSGPVPLALGKVPTSSTVRGLDIHGNVLTLAAGKVPSPAQVRGLGLSNGPALQLGLGHVTSTPTVRGVGLSQRGPVALQLGKIASTATVRGVRIVTGAIHSIALADTARGSLAVATTAKGALLLADSAVGTLTLANAALGSLNLTDDALGELGLTDALP